VVVPGVIVDSSTTSVPDVPEPLDERREVREEILLVRKRRLDGKRHRVALRDLREKSGVQENFPAPTTFLSNSSSPGSSTRRG